MRIISFTCLFFCFLVHAFIRVIVFSSPSTSRQCNEGEVCGGEQDQGILRFDRQIWQLGVTWMPDLVD